MLKNVLEYLEQTVEQVPDRLAFADEAHTLTFSELYQPAVARYGPSRRTALP